MSAVPAFALVVAMAGTESAPTAGLANPGWGNVTDGGGANYIYLGDSWILSARHVGTSTAFFNIGGNTVTFNPIPNQNFVLSNPAGSGLTAQTDLRLLRINGIPAGLPSIFDANPAFSIATQSPSLNDQIMFVGQGNGRADSLSFWDNSWNSVPAGSATHSGYVASGTFAKRWGLNNVASNSVFGDNGAGVTHVVNLMTGDGIARDVMSLATQFDQSSGTFEAQGVGGDSGTSVFRKNPSTNKWELAGIVNAIFTFSNQPGGTAVYGDLTTFADLSYYRNSIYSIINSHQAYSLPGDLNLDGVVSGNGTGSVTTDDVTAFVQGWGSQQATGDINSWKKGDLNLDGKVDVLDFLMLRQAFNASGSGASLQSLSALVGQGGGTGGVPEPSSVLLAATGAALLVWLGRRRRVVSVR